MIVPFKASYRGLFDVTIHAVTDTSAGRLYWVRSVAGSLLRGRRLVSLPASLFRDPINPEVG